MDHDVDDLIKNWQMGVLADGAHPFPATLRRGASKEYVLDWVLYHRVAQRIEAWLPEMKTVFLAEYAPFKTDRTLRQQGLRSMPQGKRERLLRMALFDLRLE